MIDFTDYSKPPVAPKQRLRDHLNWFDLVLAVLVLAAIASGIFEAR